MHRVYLQAAAHSNSGVGTFFIVVSTHASRKGPSILKRCQTFEAFLKRYEVALLLTFVDITVQRLQGAGLTKQPARKDGGGTSKTTCKERWGWGQAKHPARKRTTHRQRGGRGTTKVGGKTGSGKHTLCPSYTRNRRGRGTTKGVRGKRKEERHTHTQTHLFDVALLNRFTLGGNGLEDLSPQS